MTAKELSVEQKEDRDRIIELEKTVSYLTQECDKLRMLVGDLKVSVTMLERVRS